MVKKVMVVRKATPKSMCRNCFLKKIYGSTERFTNTLGGYVFNLKYEIETIKISIQHPKYQPICRDLNFPGSIG